MALSSCKTRAFTTQRSEVARLSADHEDHLVRDIANSLDGKLVKDRSERSWRVQVTTATRSDLQFRWNPLFDPQKEGVKISEESGKSPHVSLYFDLENKYVHAVGEYPPVSDSGLSSTVLAEVYGPLPPGFLVKSLINNHEFRQIADRFFSNPIDENIRTIRDRFYEWVFRSREDLALQLWSHIISYSLLQRQLDASSILTAEEVIARFAVQYFTPQGRLRTKSGLLIRDRYGTSEKLPSKDYESLQSALVLLRLFEEETKASLDNDSAGIAPVAFFLAQPLLRQAGLDIEKQTVSGVPKILWICRDQCEPQRRTLSGLN